MVITPTLLRPKIAAFRMALIIWGFALLTAHVAASFGGRMRLPAAIPLAIPLFIMGVTLTMAVSWLRLRLHILPPILAWGITILAIFAATAIQTEFDLNYYRWLALNFIPEWQSWALNFAPLRYGTAGLLYLWLFGLAVTLLWALGLYDVSRINALRASASEAAALRLQLNPHFMINTLNAVASLISTGRTREAEEVTCRLADFLRPSLKADPTAFVSLDEEIGIVEAYLEIEQVRCGERLEIDVDLDDDVAQARVPNFILQPLVENAVKYGVAPNRARVRVSVHCREEGNEVAMRVVNKRLTDDGFEERSPRASSAGVGLSNVRQRLLIAYGGEARLETEALVDGYRAEIRVPRTGAPESF